MADPTAPDSPERHLEVEAKLDADAGFVMPALAGDASVRRCGVVAAGPAAVHLLDAVYFDTDGLDLLRSRLTLRRRTGGTDAGWHLKLPAAGGARTEVRVPLSGSGSGGDEVPETLAALVLGAARGRPLVPVARLSTRRTARHLLDGAGRPLAEIADDEVTGRGLLPDGPGESRWREIEVELEQGTAELQTAVVGLLVAAGARLAGAASKVGRLLGAAAGPVGAAAVAGAATVVGAAAVAGAAADVGAETGTGAGAVAGAAAANAGTALTDYLARQRDLLIDADIRLRAPDPDVEAPHDARAAARRIRSVLRVYGPLLAGPTTASIADRLQRLGRAASEVRDLDVARVRLAGSGGCHPGAAALDRRLSGRRSGRLAAVHALLSGRDHLALLRDLDALVQDPPLTRAADGPADAVLAPRVAAAWSRFRADAEKALAGADPAGGGPADRSHPAVPAGDDARMHRVRKDAKTARYAADAAAGAGGALGEAMAAFAAVVERVQDVLGAHQDSVTARALIASLRGDPDLGGDEGALLDRWSLTESAEAGRTRAAFAQLWPQLPAVPPER